MFFKILICVTFAGFLWQTILIWKYGRKLRLDPRDLDILAHHKEAVAISGALGLAAVGLIEYLLQTSPVSYEPDLLKWVHLGFVVLLIAVVSAIICRFTGIRHRIWHHRLVRVSFVLLVAVAGTGGVMLYRLPV